MKAVASISTSVTQRLSNFLYTRPRLVLFLLLGPPLIWMVGIYFSSLAGMLMQSFFHLDDFTGQVVHEFTLSTYRQLFTASNLDIVKRTASMAASVTIACFVIAFPLAYYMARYAPRRIKALLYLSVTLPLWSSYLVKVYAWKLILAKEGIFSWVIGQLHLSFALDWLLRIPSIGGPSLSISPIGIFLVFVYVWLPYMVLPIQAALERVPKSLLEASEDLGARPQKTFRHVLLPLAVPGVIAGSIFTFSLTLGDFIVPSVMGNSSYYIGQAVLSHQGTSGNIPLAAAMTAVPMAIMAGYLILARKLGAFDAI
jgi:putative spermidine/putrescine transport system permease protein